jgi:hypothetical protein
MGFEVSVRIENNTVSPPASPIPVNPPPRTWGDVTLGSIPQIDQAAAGLVRYVSPNTAQDQNQSPSDQAAVDELAKLRGWAEKDEAVHKILSWAIRKDYPVHVGISLEIPDPIGTETYEVASVVQSTSSLGLRSVVANTKPQRGSSI